MVQHLPLLQMLPHGIAKARRKAVLLLLLLLRLQLRCLLLLRVILLLRRLLQLLRRLLLLLLLPQQLLVLLRQLLLLLLLLAVELRIWRALRALRRWRLIQRIKGLSLDPRRIQGHGHCVVGHWLAAVCVLCNET